MRANHRRGQAALQVRVSIGGMPRPTASVGCAQPLYNTVFLRHLDSWMQLRFPSMASRKSHAEEDLVASRDFGKWRYGETTISVDSNVRHTLPHTVIHREERDHDGSGEPRGCGFE